MDNKQFSRRSLGLVALLALLLFGLGAALYDAQVINGSYWAARSSTNITDTETVTSVRGSILDRYGRVLVSNYVTYQVTLNTTSMGKEKERNEILASLIQVARQSGVEWEDNLPISTQPPFTYTGDTPFYSVSKDEEGNLTKSLTRLGQLAVKMKWLSGDPTDPDKNVALPTAEELLGKMCTSFSIAGEGALDPKKAKNVPTLNIGDMDPSDARLLAGVLYELYYRDKVNNWPPYVFAKDVDIDFISRVKERGLAGVEIEAVTARQYNTTYAAHLLGRIGAITNWDNYKDIDEDGDGVPDYRQNDMVGLEGAEYVFESYLRGSPGERQVDRDTSGKIVDTTWITQPEPGDNVVLTIDIDLQQAVEDILANAIPEIERRKPEGSAPVEGAAAVVLDVNSGEVLASASYPTYNLATYSKDFSENNSNPLRPFNNRAFSGLYAPGSTFKMVTAIAGLETGIITPSTIIKDTGRYTYYNDNGPMCWIFRDYGTTHGNQNVTQAIKNSCNVFFFDVGRQVTIQGLQEYAAYFGFGEATGVELPENTGAMAGPTTPEEEQEWKIQAGRTLSVAIGQESTQVTPLQLANYIATLVNGGTRRAVHLLKEVKSSDFSQVLYTQEPEVLNTIAIAPEHLEAVKQGMLLLTTDGSVSSYFKGLPVQAGAKTGSAQVSGQTDANAIFVCFAPYDDPQIAIAIAVEKGGSGSYIGGVAAEILKYYFSAEETREEILTENTLIR